MKRNSFFTSFFCHGFLVFVGILFFFFFFFCVCVCV